MNDENDFMAAFFQEAAMQLLNIGSDNFDDKDFGGCVMGDLFHLQVLDMKGEVCFQVVGKNGSEAAHQLVLACFHNISIEHLGALHQRPLNRPLQVRKEKSP